jgi:N-acetylmuramoyl-L-alanine amidase
MRPKLIIKTLSISLYALLCTLSWGIAQASQFTSQQINQKGVVVIARPYGEGKYDLLVVEQVQGKRKCWQEKERNPVVIDPLLLKFDFTGSCRRATDSNGYSVRINGEDRGLEYLLRVVPSKSELCLVATPRSLPVPDIVIGRTNGLKSSYLKIALDPGWQITKRVFNKRALGHFYFELENENLINPKLSCSNSQKTKI